MNEQVKKQSSYFQTRENAAKLGAYYTDPEHCKMIANILEFPEEDVCCLEPAIGDANAICIVAEKEKHQNIHIYGVELNQKTSDTTVLNPYVEECLWGDFLTDVIISHKAFSFCFSNPPYGDLNGTRQEILFLNKLLPYLMIDAVLVYIIPYHVAASQDFQRIWAGALTIEKIFRFHDKEYEKWKQIVLIGRKKDKKSKSRIQSDEVVSEIPKLEEISLLPITYQGERIKVNPSQSKGNRGEYAMLTDMMCGTNFEIKSNTGNIMNIFDIDKEEEWSELNGSYEVLRLQDKIANAKSDMMTLIQGNKEPAEFSLVTYIERIVTDIITEMYEERGIYDNVVESLYESGKGLKNGVITSGKIRKKMPILTDFYKKALEKNKANRISEHRKAYRIILDSLKDRVKELYYCPECIHFFSREEWESGTRNCSCGGEIKKITGSKAYYDGQSTIKIKENEHFTNIDISQLPEMERPIARQISLSFLNEQFIKTNATNPQKTECLAVIVDEVHENFGMKSAVASLDYVARTSRKRLVSLWTATQALLGVQSNERGGFFSAMALLALGRTIAGKTKGAIKRGADIRSDLEKSRAHKEMADADEEESDAILGGFGQNTTQSRAGQGTLEELSSRDENSLGELDTSAIDAGGPEERSVEDYDAGYSEDPFYSAYDTDLERHESMPVQAEDFGESEIIGESEGEFLEGIPERAGTAGEGIEENRTSNESIKAGALEGKPEEMETQEGNVPEDLKETEVSGGVNGEVLSRNQILRDLDKSMEQKQRTIDALKVQKAGFQTEQKRVESQMLNHDRGSEEYRQLEKQRAQMALRASETEQKIAGQMQNLNQLRNEAKAVKGSMAGATPTLFDDKKAEILCKRANINNFDQPEFRNALSNAQMAKLYQKRAAQNLAKGAAATVGTFAGGAMLGGAAMFMQPGTAMMGVTAGASAGAVVGSGIISAGVAASGTAKWAGNKVRFIKEVEQSKIGTGVDFADAYAQAPVYSGAAQTMGQPIMENQPKQRTVSPVSVKTRSSQVEDVIVVPKQTVTLSEMGVENIQQVENTVQKIQEEIEQDSIRALQKVFSPAGMFKNSVALTALERANVEAEKYFATLRETGAPELTRKQEIEKRVDFQTRCITEEVLDSLSISPDYEKGTENYRKAEEIIHTKVRMIVEKRNKDLF